MAKKFSVEDLMNDVSKADICTIQYEIEFIKIDDLIPSKENFYSINDIELLSSLIEFGGLQQNLAVWNDDGVYRILSGHRRHQALMLLRKKGNELYERVPCLIIEAETLVDAEMQLLIGNMGNRHTNDYEKMQEAIRFGELIETKRQNGENIPGRKRELIAEMLNISKTQVGRYQSIDKNLSTELKKEFQKGNINVTTAAELSRLDNEKQTEKLKKISEGKKVNATTISAEIKESEEVKAGSDEVAEDNDSDRTKNVPIMGTNAESENCKSDKNILIKSILKKYSDKLEMISLRIDSNKQINVKPFDSDLKDYEELKIVVEALELLDKEVW